MRCGHQSHGLSSSFSIVEEMVGLLKQLHILKPSAGDTVSLQKTDMVLQNVSLPYTVSLIYMKTYQGFHHLITFGASSLRRQLKGKVIMEFENLPAIN